MSFRYSLAWLHTWSGLVLGWVLYFMFITGSAGYFDSEIDRWMQPEIPILKTPFSITEKLPVAEARLQQVAPNASQQYITLPIGRSPFFSLWWHNPDGWHSETLDPNTGEKVIARDTRGGEFLYRLHYRLHYIPAELAYWLTSLAAMFMLLAIISGIIIHKRIFKDFFALRRKKHKRFWLDTHNLLSVLPLPFHIMVTYSGLMLLMFSTMLAVPIAVFGPDDENLQALYDTVFSEPQHRQAAGIATASAPLLTLYNKALIDGDQATIAYIKIDHPGDLNAVVEMGVVAKEGLEPYRHLYYDAVSAEPYIPGTEYSHTSSAVAFYELMEALHEGLFASPLLRWLYFLSGLMGAGMVASGTLLWLIKRRDKQSNTALLSNRLRQVECLNVGIVAGLPIAIAAYFWANRMLPVELEVRADWEIHIFFMVWLLALFHPFLRWRKQSLRRLWAEQLMFAAIVYGLIPVINLITTDSHLGVSLFYRDWVLAGFDLFMLVLAMGFGYTAYHLASSKQVKA